MHMESNGCYFISLRHGHKAALSVRVTITRQAQGGWLTLGHTPAIDIDSLLAQGVFHSLQWLVYS